MAVIGHQEELIGHQLEADCMVNFDRAYRARNMQTSLAGPMKRGICYKDRPHLGAKSYFLIFLRAGTGNFASGQAKYIDNADYVATLSMGQM